MAVQLRDLDAGSIDLLPTANIHGEEERSQASGFSTPDIYGAPVVVTKELPSGNQAWTLSAAYLPLSYAQACVTAYQNAHQLQFTDELGQVTAVVLCEYPGIERVKSGLDVLYNLKITVRPYSTGFPTPPTLSLTGPRLFGR